MDDDLFLFTNDFMKKIPDTERIKLWAMNFDHLHCGKNNMTEFIVSNFYLSMTKIIPISGCALICLS